MRIGLTTVSGLVALIALGGCALTVEPRYSRPFILGVIDGAQGDGGGEGLDAARVDAAIGADGARDGASVDGASVEAGVADAGVGCDPGLQLCGEHCVSLRTSVEHCGACGRRCAAPANGSATCVSGLCGIVCAPGFADCDGNPSNGCESRLDTVSNCGRCGNRCAGANARCNATTGACVTECPSGTTACGAACVNVSADANNCGACGRVCPSGANGTATCTAGACGLACNLGFGNCDGSPTNGCETNLTTNVAHCGRCGGACPSLANATVRCGGGMCAFGGCLAGFANCDSIPSNGCEVNLSTNPNHCGACGRSCGGGTCTAGFCIATMTCTPPEMDCGGTCVDTSLDPNNCGSCGTRCATPPNSRGLCSSGTCGSACLTGFGNCDGSFANGCETPLNTALNCGRCGAICPMGASCVGGACSSTSCPVGQILCGGTCVLLDVSNCGACGRACGAGQLCLGASCVVVACPVGFEPCAPAGPMMPARCCASGSSCSRMCMNAV